MKTFAFDLGSGSIGECVREDEKVLHLASLLIDSDFAELDQVRAKRRAYRTRLSHKAREAWWNKCAREGGLEVLSSAQPTKNNINLKADLRMLREFPAAGDETIYTSCLLRISLLQGKQLDGWQIYKAIWSAIQHRGYDANLPWISEIREILRKEELNIQLTDREKKIKEDHDKESKAVRLYEEKIKECLPEGCRLPCYFEAYKLGLWTPSGNTFLNKLSSAPGNIRNKENREQIIIPRQYVEQELILLLDNARKQYPKLPDTQYILYGTPKKKYSSLNNPANKKYESEGILGQKIPRFDNRIISKCSCIQRLNVCKAKDILNLEVCFLLSLLNMRFTYGNTTSAQLEPEQLKQIFEDYKQGISINKTESNVLVGQKDWKKEIEEGYGGKINENQKSIPHPNPSGRSRFSRPALLVLKDLILSGMNPHEFYAKQILQLSNTNKLKGLVKDDYEFLLEMPNDWHKIHIPDLRNQDKNISRESAVDKIETILSSVTNSIVRHRLTMFLRRLQYLSKEFGAPDVLIVEVAREELLSLEKKNKYIQEQNDNREEKDKAIKEITAEITSENILKMRLFREQNGIDVYDLSDKNTLIIENLAEYDIDHIVPVSLGGADSYINKVLTKRELNQSKKKNRTPYQWLFENGSKEIWAKYRANLERAYGKKSDRRLHKKIELLTSDAAVEIEQARNDLQATMYIEKLAQRISSIFFGWGQQTKGDKRTVFVCPGGLTAKIRREYGLNRLLHNDISKEEFINLIHSGKLDEKNRKNDRHHALDAVVISFANELTRDEKGKNILPKYATPPYFDAALSKVFPKNIRKIKPLLRKTIYALRCRQEESGPKYYMVSRFNTNIKEVFGKIKDAPKAVEKIFDLKIREDFRQKLAKNPSQEQWTEFLDAYKVAGNTPVFKIATTMSKAFEPKEVLNPDNSFKQVIGEYKEMGKMNGQYFMPESDNKGQIVYKENGKWKIEQIYAFDSEIKKIEEAKAKYGKVLFWSSGDTIVLQKDINGMEVYQEEKKEEIEYKDRNGEIKTRIKIKRSPKRRPSLINAGKYRINSISQGEITSLSSGRKYAASLGAIIEDAQAYKER